MVTLLLRPIALSLLRRRRLHHQCLLVHLYHLEEVGGIVVKEMMTEERIIPACRKKITRPYRDNAHAHITGGKEAIAEIMVEDIDEEKRQDDEIPREEVIITMTNHYTKIILGKGNENTVPLPLVPPKMIPQVISKEAGGHL